jgi:chloride channel protein, CIC family
VPLLAAGVIGGAGWFLLRRFTAGKPPDVDDSIWTGDGTLSFRRSAGCLKSSSDWARGWVGKRPRS